MKDFSGADIAGACRKAVMRAVGRGQAVGAEDVREAFEGTKRSVKREMAEKIARWKPP